MGSAMSTESTFNYGYAGAVASYLFFSLNMRYLLPLALPPVIRSAPPSTIWKWKNTVNSLIHSTITGCGSFYNLWRSPMLREDLIDYSTTPSVLINSIAVGYFIYDFIDLAVNHFMRSRALLFHHSLVTICFGLALVTGRYQGYSMVALLVEINSIFLHIRQLSIIHGLSKFNIYYRANSIINIGTFLVFRLLTLSYQAGWLYINQNKVNPKVVTLGFLTSAVILILNVILFVQILKKDCVRNITRSHSS